MISNSLCSKYNISNLKKQDSNKKLFDPTPHRLIRANLEGFCNSLTLSEQKIFNFFLTHFNKYQDIYFSQITLSNILGISREHINRMIKKLCQYGFIYKWSRFKTSCLYRVSSYFLKPEIRSSLSWIFNALKKLPIFWLFSNFSQIEIPVQNQHLKTNVTLINRLYLYNYSYSNTLYSNSNTSLENQEELNLKKSNDIKNSKCEEESVSNLTYSKTHETINIPLSDAKLLAKSKLNLTQHGIVSLFVFDDKAIMHSLNSLKPSNKPKEDEFKLFCSMAHKWHSENKILRKFDERDALEAIYPIPSNAKMTFETPKKDYSKREEYENKNESKNNFKKNLIYPEPLPGLPEDTLARIKARREGTYVPVVETREEAAAKIETYLASEQGQKMQKILGNLTNPFLDKPKKEVTPNIKSNGFIKNLNSALNFNQDNGFNNFYD